VNPVSSLRETDGDDPGPTVTPVELPLVISIRIIAPSIPTTLPVTVVVSPA